jgi:phosphoserine phosphatase
MPDTRPFLAAFDWDNTCIYNDIGDAVFDRLLRMLDVRLDAAELASLLPQATLGVPRRDPLLAALAAGRRGDREGAAAFRAGMHALYEDLGPAEGPHARYAWVAAVLAGRTGAELEGLADATIDEGLAAPLGTERLAAGGGREVAIARGLRPHAGIIRLARTLAAAGWDVRIVTASAAPLVRAFARRLGLDPAWVHGVRLATDPSSGRLRPRILEPFPYAEGKVATLARFEGGRLPAFVAGDSPGDLPMLRACTGIRLVVERDPDAPAPCAARAEGWLIVRSSDVLGPLP